MERALVSVRRQDELAERDMEVSAEVPARALAVSIAAALGWAGDWVIEARPPGRALHPDESLGAAGAWDGAALTLRPAHYRDRSPAPELAGPLGDADAQTLSRSGGFAWKQLDV